MNVEVKNRADGGMARLHGKLSRSGLPASPKSDLRNSFSVLQIDHAILADSASEGRAWLWALLALGLIILVIPLMYSAFRAGESAGGTAPAPALGPETLGQLLPGWSQGGDNHTDYVTGTQSSVPGFESEAMFVRSTTTIPGGFSTAMKTLPANPYRAKRVTLTGTIRAEDVVDWAGMWLRIDGPGDVPLGFDNMQDRPIKGTQEAQTYTITMDVPADAQGISYGVLLTGAGKVWFNEIHIGS